MIRHPKPHQAGPGGFSSELGQRILGGKQTDSKTNKTTKLPKGFFKTKPKAMNVPKENKRVQKSYKLLKQYNLITYKCKTYTTFRKHTKHAQNI
jgi:hypothetical protein